MIISIISIISSLVITVVTVVFNYLSTKKSKDLEEKKIKIEYIYKTKLEIYEKLMEDFGRIFSDYNYSTEEKFLASLNKALLVSNQIVQIIILQTMNLLQLHKGNEAIAYFKNNLSEIAADMQDSKAIVNKPSTENKKNNKKQTKN